MSEEVLQDHSNYFEERMQELGIDPATYTITCDDELPVFEKLDDGSIAINYFDIEGRPAVFQPSGVKHQKRYRQTRHIPGTKTKKGEELRYSLPRGGGTRPFLPPGLIEKYKAGEEITTLVITEGVFKAVVGEMKGIDVVGLPSITHSKSSETKKLHPDLDKIVKKCKVKRVVWLHDGDARNITRKFPEVEPEVDLYKRPNIFYKTIWTIKNLFNDYEGLTVYYACIRSEAIAGDPKGLDDMLLQLEINFPPTGEASVQYLEKKYKQIREELSSTELHCEYFFKFDVTFRMDDVRRWFALDSVLSFYLHHAGKIQEREFIFNGTKYRYNTAKGECDIILDRRTKDYIRVGTTYYKWVEIPTIFGKPERDRVEWTKATIIDDFGKDFLQHIQKYDQFCNVPNHVDYQQVINNCYNSYFPLPWTDREEGEWDSIHNFLVHIFGDDPVTITDPGTGKEITVNSLDLGLDYIQLLYQSPTQQLPILCLVSEEKETGKSTFGDLMKAIFSRNVITVGNTELASDFNAIYASKLLIMCEEVLIEKKLQLEKIKALATGKRIVANEKGVRAGEQDFFGKFIFFSNNRRNFINTDKHETRFWVREIPRLKESEKNPKLLEEMYEEIPAFLYYLDERKLATERRTRSWFAHDLLRTDALQVVIENSLPTVEKEIRAKIARMFELDEFRESIFLSTSDISNEFFKGNRYEHSYINDICGNRLELTKARDGKVMRYSYPVIHEYFDKGEHVWKMDIIEKKGHGRAWEFKRADFVTDELEYDIEPDPFSQEEVEKRATTPQLPYKDDKPDDLPF